MKSKEKTKKYTTAKVDSIRKRFAVGCLAVLMCGTAIFGVACTPTTATSGTQGIGSSSSANGGAGSPAGTNTSPFNLKPETDPVVYTTESGLEIKCSNALTNTNLASYTYFTMGEYEGTPVNWVIIGYDPSMSTYVGEYSGEVSQADPIQGGHSVDSTVDDSPMGEAIMKEMFAISSEAKPNEEIGDGCVLCLSENVIESTAWSSTNYSIVKYFSNEENYVRKKCASYYENDTFKFEADLLRIQVITLQQVGDYRQDSYSSVPAITQTALHFFPLATAYVNNAYPDWSAHKYENFKYNDYLTDAAYTCGYDIFGRSNQTADDYTYFTATGNAHFAKWYADASYIRPAFVMKLV